MVHIRGHITEAEYDYLMETLNREFLNMELARGILAKITVNREEKDNGRLGNPYKCKNVGRR